MASQKEIDQSGPGELFKPPPFSREDSVRQEELAFLCMLDHYEITRHLQPHSWHWEKHRDWIAKQIESAKQGHHEVVRDVSRLQALTPPERQKKITELRKELAKSSKAPMAMGMARVRDNCEAIFTGRKDALTLLMRGNTLARIYDVGSFDHSDFMQDLSRKNPALRVLEVGAGTGGTTAKFLGEPDFKYQVYTFSDLSAGFFSQARRRFSSATNMEYKVFDVSKDPASQGFEPAFYDLVLAPQVLHATPSLCQTLRNVRFLLRPGGRLVLTETVVQAWTTQYFFGVFEGWWLGEADGRADGPCVTRERWDKELHGAGFSGVDYYVMDAEPPFGFCALMVSHAI